MDFRQVWKDVRIIFRRRSPEILTGIGIGGMFGTTVLAVMATPEAMRRIEERKKELGTDRLSAGEMVKAAWKCYIPAVVTGTVSTACVVGASRVSSRRNAALATAASVAETSLREYRGKVLESLGEKKERAIQDAIDRERIEKNPPPPELREAPITEGTGGTTLCYDAWFGRYFYSDIETIKHAVNKLNRQMSTMSEPYISLNEFYMEIGLSRVDVGDELGWNVNDGMIDLNYTSQLANGRTPCLVISHLMPPKYDYYK